MNGHRKDAFVRGGHGRHLQNKMSKTTKNRLDRRVDKRRRAEAKRPYPEDIGGYVRLNPDQDIG